MKLKPIKTPLPMPSSIIKRAASIPEPNALFILLDGIAYVEAFHINRIAFDNIMSAWISEILPTLRRSQVRYFLRNKNLALTEVRP